MYFFDGKMKLITFSALNHLKIMRFTNGKFPQNHYLESELRVNIDLHMFTCMLEMRSD